MYIIEGYVINLIGIYRTYSQCKCMAIVKYIYKSDKSYLYTSHAMREIVLGLNNW